MFPVERLYAAKVVYYSMVFSVTVTVLSVPYDAVIILMRICCTINSRYNRFFCQANNCDLYCNICVRR